MSKRHSFLSITKQVLPLVIRTEKKDFLIYLMIDIFHGMSFGVVVIMIQKFFDSIVAAAESKEVGQVIFMMIMLSVAQLTSQALNGFANYYAGYIKNKVIGKLNVMVSNKAKKMRPIEYEKPERLDDLNKASEGIQNACDLVDIVLSVFSFYMPYFILMAIYLFHQTPFLMVGILCVFVPVCWGQMLKTRIFSELTEHVAPIKRATTEYKKTLTDHRFLKETRSLGSIKFFQSRFKESIMILNENVLRASKRSAILGVILSMMSLLGYLVTLWMLIQFVVQRRISIGAFAAILASLEIMFLMMEEAISDQLSQASEKSGSVQHFLNYLAILEQPYEAQFKTDERIILRNVSFKYPGSTQKAVNGINLEIEDQEKVAIVGLNGSGKTTLTKLIMGLYEPTEGEVMVHGLDTKKAAPSSIYLLFSAVFQKFVRFKMTLEHNIKISQFEKNEEIHGAMKSVDFEIKSSTFPQGKETVLSREFDGVDLSGGQWQRIAIARAYYRDHQVILLDEPTAAIDPLEEANLYQQFHDISLGKTSIIVTHRLGLAKIADRIIFLEKGEMLDQGTHEELMKRCKSYKKMWTSQSSWYERH